tara:strand:+ start:3164 stop:3985 length:822 start_codon:yes stop_codon:yes gene_type:complete
MAAYGNENAGNDSKNTDTQSSAQMSPSYQSLLQRSGQLLNSYEPVEDYIFVPVSETDPWFTPSYIETFHTAGGELFVKRDNDSIPTNVAETYVGPYFRWKKSPQYGDSAKGVFGKMNDLVVGKSYYGLYGKGKPKNVGLTQNRVLDSLTVILRKDVGGPMFVPENTPDASVVPDASTHTERNVAAKAGIMLDETAMKSPTLPDAIIINDHDDKKFIHITDLVTLEDALTVLDDPSTDMRALAPTATRYGMKGRAPIITNQPNAKIDFGNEGIS